MRIKIQTEADQDSCCCRVSVTPIEKGSGNAYLFAGRFRRDGRGAPTRGHNDLKTKNNPHPLGTQKKMRVYRLYLKRN
jgi:hypothetical protein